MKEEIEERDAMWREELRVRDAIFWVELGKQEFNLYKMLEARDRSMKTSPKSRDIGWLNILQHFKDSLRLITQELINNKCTLESIGKRQRELVKGNGEILDWVMKIVSGKKKVPLPNIQISNYGPYTIVPKDVTNLSIPFTNPEEPREIPFVPFKTLPQDETYGTIRMSRRTLEDIEKY